jgi:hypothetical protein
MKKKKKLAFTFIRKFNECKAKDRMGITTDPAIYNLITDMKKE